MSSRAEQIEVEEPALSIAEGISAFLHFHDQRGGLFRTPWSDH